MKRTNHASLVICGIIITVLSSSHFTSLATSQSSPVEQKCQPTNSFFCNIDNYNTVQPFNNTLGQNSLETARSELHKYAFLLTLEQCKNRVQLFLCSLYFPVCVSPPDVTPRLLLPCRDICEEARACESELIRVLNIKWPSEWDCNNFEYYGTTKLCVINNEKEKQPSENEASRALDLMQAQQTARFLESKQELGNKPLVSVDRGPAISPVQQLLPLVTAMPENPSVCDHDFFDCQLSDPKRPLCIEMKYRCDGKKDCFRNDSIFEINEGLDEMNCPKRCTDGQIHCDDKCIMRDDICDGKVDCSSGLDEQDCYDNLTGLIQSILCIFVMSSAVFILIKFLRVENELENGGNYETSGEGGNNSLRIHGNHSPVLLAQDQYKQPQPLNKMATTLSQFEPQPRLLHLSSHSIAPTEQMYQEVSTRGDDIDNYERVLPGGYSGASSIYTPGSYLGDEPFATTRSVRDRDFSEPVAPPPTRSATPIYQTTPTRQASYTYMQE